ncbi:MAG: hypothetical protein WCS69_10530 [Ignavibacteriaceae bacterium]|jgi:hypothetical protein
MNKFLTFTIVLILHSFVTAQVTHQIIYEKKYEEFPFGIRMENSGNYSIASFDVVNDSIFFTNFNDPNIYVYAQNKSSVQRTLQRRTLDLASASGNNDTPIVAKADDQSRDFLLKKTFYGKSRVFRDEGGVLSGVDGELIKVQVENNNHLLIEYKMPGLSHETNLIFPSNLACADLIGIDAAGNSYVLIETYITQIPLSVKREVYTITKEGTILSRLELPSTKYIYTIKDLQIDAAGNLFHLYSDENGIKIFKWSGLANHDESEFHYPAEFIRKLPSNSIKLVEEPKQEHFYGVNTPVSRATALKIGESYALHQYKCSSTNLSAQNVIGPDNDIVRTPAWLVVGSNARIPYKWGGFNTLDEYDAALSNGKYAGDINTSGVSSYAVGVDCSGFVSRCWQLSRQYSTREMPDITIQYANWDLLKPGDAILIPGHVRLFVNRTPNGYFRVVEASARGWDVSYWTYSVSDLSPYPTAYTPRYYNNMESAANTNQPSLLHAIVLSDGKVFLSWNCDTTNILGYRVYHSINGESWSLLFDENACKTNSVNLSTANDVEYFRVASVNKVGAEMSESNWSNSMGVKKSSTPKCLIVDGFKRNEGGGSWEGAGHTFAVKYGKALANSFQNFETVSNTEILDSTVQLKNYEMIFWISGDESTSDETFSHIEQTLIKNYLEDGGKFFVSGSEIGWDLSNKGDAADNVFYLNYFKSVYKSDNAGSNSVKGLQNSSMRDCQFNFGQTYEEDYPDEINPAGGSIQCMQYANGKGAGNQYAGVFGTSSKIGRIIYLAFPLETTADDSAFNKVISKSIDFFTSSTSSINQGEERPTGFYLSQNYPNPFNPSTMISYSLAVNSFVTMKIFDILGNEVATLVNEEQPAGNYEVSVSMENRIQKTSNGFHLSSGIYLYQICAVNEHGEFVASKKMIILK